MASFKDRLEEALNLRNMKPTELAKISGISEGAISQYRKGAYTATQRNLEKIARALQVPIPWLMGATDSALETVPSGYKEIMARNIKRYMESKGITNQKLCDDLGFKYTTFMDWIKAVTYPRIEKIEALADYFGIQKSDLIENSSTGGIPIGYQPLPQMANVPLVGQIACGTPILAEENIEDVVSIPAQWHANFTLICKGDSMTPTVQDGDLVAIRAQPEVANGEIAAVRIDNEATLKRVYIHAEYIELRPENPDYPSIIRRRLEMNDVHIEGKAVGFAGGCKILNNGTELLRTQKKGAQKNVFVWTKRKKRD